MTTLLGCVYASACFFFIFCCSAAEVSYSDHCATIVPESNPTARVPYPDFSYTLSDLSSHYYFWGGNKILDHLSTNSSDHPQNLNFSKIHVSFRPSYRNVFRTASPGVYKLEANLVFRTWPDYELVSTYSGSVYNYRSSGNFSARRTSLRFALQGFWSEDLKRLCMVGKSKSSHNFESVFELAFGKDSDSNVTIFTSLVKGSLKSLSPYSSSNYFDAIKIVSFPYIKDYNYTLSLLEKNDLDIPPKQSLSLKEDSFCSTFQYHTYEFDLEYAPGCSSPTSKGCSPLEGHPAPSYLSLSAFQCSEEGKLRYTVSFWDQKYVSYYSRSHTTFNPYSTFIGEGTWDSERNHLSIVACTILNPIEDSANVSVGECSFRLSLRFPVVWTIKNTSSIVGLAWSNKTETEFGYFKDIKLSKSSSRYTSMDNGAGFMPGLRYEYTQTEKVREVCPGNSVRKSGDHLRYPKGKPGGYHDISFTMSAKNAKESVGWGEAVPIAVGDEIYGGNSGIVYVDSYGEEDEESISHGGPMNISYKLSFSEIKFQDKFISMEVYAEGVYDAETGHLCMVGCRNMHQFNESEKLLDCEMVMEFQFPALDSKVGSSINGFIESRRKKEDSLYFKPLNISGSTYYSVYAEKTIERMDVEIILVLISNTLLCVFIASQILYVMKHSEALQSVSLFMLVVLTLGHMIPLVLNLEALLLKNHDHQQQGFLHQGSKIEFGEVSVRLVSLIVFLLLLRLLQIKWSARMENSSEKKPAFVTFVLYCVGGVFTLLVQWSFSSVSTLKFLKSYGGLVLDGFLLPQIILNLFRNPAHKKSLSCWFYMGATLIRLFPHAYDFYRERNFIARGEGFSGTSSYIYANPGVDFYSIAWDVAIPCGCVLFSGIIWLQQRYGGRCILPLRIQELLSYEKLPTAIVGY